MEAIPGIRILSNALRQRGRNGLPLRTWGGRLYLPEAPRLIKGVMRSFEYKLLNYLIQGSAADQTKQTIIDWDQMYGNDGLFLAALHDEINLSIPRDYWINGMAHLQEVMNRARFDVPMLSEGFVGPNFGDLDAVVAQ
jgi:DNA polymerase I-like protein with 3'-5' exonuclease and polymerase domains